MQKRDLNRSSRKKETGLGIQTLLLDVYFLPFLFVSFCIIILFLLKFLFFFSISLSHLPCSLFRGSPWHITFKIDLLLHIHLTAVACKLRCPRL